MSIVFSRRLLILFAALLCLGTAERTYADPTTDEVIELEKKALALSYAADNKALALLLADDFQFLSETGRQTKADMLKLDAANDNPPASKDFKAQVLGPDVILVTYLVDGETSDGGSKIWTSSVWARRDGKWLNVFAQGTTVPPPAEAAPTN